MSTSAFTFRISGFRSLTNFEIGLRSGLNVLVGPNGSGKTNFIDFLDLIDDLVRFGASSAVSRAGGVSRVFSVEQSKSKTPVVTANIRGVAEVNDSSRGELNMKFFNFEYDIELKFSKFHSAIYISKEELKLKKLRSEDENEIADQSIGTISVQRRTPEETFPPKFKVSSRLYAKNNRNPMTIIPSYSPNKTPKDFLEKFDVRSVPPDESFLSSRLMVPCFDSVRYALTRGRSFNVSPALARQPDELTRDAIINRDGSGLSATLYHLQMARKSRNARRSMRQRRLPREGLDTIIEWTKLVFPSLEDIEVLSDPHSGKYLVYLIVSAQERLRISLQSASDGTIKWLSLVSSLITPSFINSIEEPENFLHPRMQEFLVHIIRDSLSIRRESSYFLISTHSETLINKCTPEELTLFDFENNKTSCRRIKNVEKVQEEINKTGFGLGYYYAANVLS